MAIKPNAQPCVILEQIIDDPTSKLQIKIERVETSRGVRTHITFHGYKGGLCAGLGDRILVFNEKGELSITETVLEKGRKPSWLSEV